MLSTKRIERLELSRLDPYPGVFVQPVGEINHYGDEVMKVLGV